METNNTTQPIDNNDLSYLKKVKNREYKLWFAKNGLNFELFWNLSSRIVLSRKISISYAEDIFMSGLQEIVNNLDKFDTSFETEKDTYFMYWFRHGVDKVIGKITEDKRDILRATAYVQKAFDETMLNYNIDLFKEPESDYKHSSSLTNLVDEMINIIGTSVREYDRAILEEYLALGTSIAVLAKRFKVSTKTIHNRKLYLIQRLKSHYQ